MVSPCFKFERELNFPFDWHALFNNILTVRKWAEPKIVGRNFTSRIRPLYILMTTPLGYWDTDRDRQRNAQCTNICISKSPTFSMRTSFLLLVCQLGATPEVCTTRQIGKKTPVAPLCELINLSATAFILTYTYTKEV